MGKELCRSDSPCGFHAEVYDAEAEALTLGLRIALIHPLSCYARPQSRKDRSSPTTLADGIVDITSAFLSVRCDSHCAPPSKDKVTAP
jgi:hypothetical protein